MDMNSLVHTKWEYKYDIVLSRNLDIKHIWKIKVDIGKILRELCNRRVIEIIVTEVCPDYVHMFVRIPPKYSVSQIMGYLKGKKLPYDFC